MDDADRISTVSYYATHWGLELEPKIHCTARATIVFGYRHQRPIALKILCASSDEQQAGAILRLFSGRGAVCCIDAFEDALLLERLIPGIPLTKIVMNGDDDHATRILCHVSRNLHTSTSVTTNFPTIRQWGESFQRYLDGPQHPLLLSSIVETAEKTYSELYCSQNAVQLLHGDLHHDNVLFDTVRGWVAIDPKGVVGEPEYEMGAALRNPTQDTRLYADASIVERRLAIMTEELGFDQNRVARWCFAQAILSSIWAVESGESDTAIYRGLATAQVMLPYL